MVRTKFNPIALYGFLGLIGIVGLITKEYIWCSWFSWFVWFGSYKKPTDERFFTNISKAGLTCFGIAVLGLMTVIIMRGLNMPLDIIFAVIGILFIILLIGFIILLEYFEKKGA